MVEIETRIITNNLHYTNIEFYMYILYIFACIISHIHYIYITYNYMLLIWFDRLFVTVSWHISKLLGITGPSRGFVHLSRHSSGSSDRASARLQSDPGTQRGLRSSEDSRAERG